MGLEREVGEPRRFSIAGDPVLRALHRIHLTRADGTPRAWALVAIAWVPLFLGALVRAAIHEQPVPILSDLSVHTRLLIGIPLLIQAERLLERRCRASTGQLYDGRFAARESLDPIFDRAERLRDSRLVEVVIVALALLEGQAVLWGLFGATGVFSGISDAGTFSFARIWYVAVAFPIVQILVLRWLWHWGIWSYVLVRLSRMQLATIATHPDHAAGIGFLASPMSAFSGFVLAISATVASVWGTKILDGDATLAAFVPVFAVFVVLVGLLASGPLLLFMGMMYRARHRELGRYNGLALDYVRAFHHRWAEDRADRASLLGSPDIQSLNDMCGAYENLVRVRLVPFGPRPIVSIWVAAVIPMLPLVLTTMPLDKLLATIGRSLLGGLPG